MASSATVRIGIPVFAAIVAAGSAGSGCASSRGAAVQAPVDLVISPLQGPAPAATITNGRDPSAQGCTVRLVAAPIEKSSSGCYLDEHISDGPGLLHFPCSGDGAAEAVFGEHHYVGRIERGEVHVEVATELDWEDGCHWGTTATISGSVLGNGNGRGGKRLAWTYLDHVINGASCSGVCRAKAVIVMGDSSSTAHGPLDRDDDDTD